ncbi:zinc finger MYM-type protein 2-like [Saccostrea echinata]|uniref:zinc finger MYM-type protein 2-like n=1 Tax=Saccostrea echinata TaxID=191078 RepID=UPI002A82BCF8|nr:zinc finger MYM-type protein 2-like [Saccostrea echinata]
MSIGDFDFGFLFGEQEVFNTEPPPETPEPPTETDEPQGMFARPITDKKIKLLTEYQECKNNKANTRWAFGVWRKWREERNKLSSNTGEFILEFSAMDATCMDYWLQRFVVEVCNQKGNEYTPKSLYYLMCGLLRHLRDIEIFGMNLLDHNDDRFARTRKVLDARIKSLVAQGMGTTVRQADPILPEQEDILWEKGVLGQNFVISLKNTVFFYACKVFGLRGCDEHRQLTVQNWV